MNRAILLIPSDHQIYWAMEATAWYLTLPAIITG